MPVKNWSTAQRTSRRRRIEGCQPTRLIKRESLPGQPALTALYFGWQCEPDDEQPEQVAS